MKAGDIMTVGAVTIGPGDSLADAARAMLEHRISGLPVVDAQGTVVGIVTERDLLRRAEIGTGQPRPRWLELWVGAGELAAEYVRAHGRKVDDVMTRNVVAIDIDTPLEDVVTLMEREGFKRLPVLRDDRIAGIVSRADLVLALSRRMIEPASLPGDDLVIRRKILDEIAAQGWAASAIIHLDVSEGTVELNGTVLDERVRRAIVVATRNVPGVKEVADKLTIMPFLPAWG